MENVRNSIGVLLVQDRPEKPCKLRCTLENEVPSARVVEASSFQQAMDLSQREQLDLILTHRELKGETCLPFLRKVTERNESLPVLVFGAATNGEERIKLILNGAWGYMDTETDTTEEALVKVLSGTRFISESTSNALSEYIRFQAERNLDHRLSNRELMVCQELKQGKSVAELAEALQLSEKTVRTYKRRAMLKLQAKSLDEVC